MGTAVRPCVVTSSDAAAASSSAELEHAARQQVLLSMNAQPGTAEARHSAASSTRNRTRRP